MALWNIYSYSIKHRCACTSKPRRVALALQINFLAINHYNVSDPGKLGLYVYTLGTASFVHRRVGILRCSPCYNRTYTRNWILPCIKSSKILTYSIQSIDHKSLSTKSPHEHPKTINLWVCQRYTCQPNITLSKKQPKHTLANH